MSIEGYTGRSVVVETLSKEMLPTVEEYQRMSPELQKEAERRMEKEGVPHEKIKIEIMEKYKVI